MNKEKINNFSLEDEKGEFIVKKENEKNNININIQNEGNKDSTGKINKESLKNLKIIIFSFTAFFIIIIISFFLFFSFHTKEDKDYLNNGIPTKEFFEISPKDFADIVDYNIDYLYGGYYDDFTIPKLEFDKLYFNEQKNCYEKIIRENNNFIFQIYPSKDKKNIKKIIVSFDFSVAYEKNDTKQQDEMHALFIIYSNLVYYGINGLDNTEDEYMPEMWETFSNIQYDNQDVGYGHSKTVHKDKKANFILEENNNGIVTMIIVPKK